jgi:ketosteroid isomerase-like protein
MSQGNATVVRRFVARINDGELDAALRDVADDATLDWSSSEAIDSGVFRGREAWLKWWSARTDLLVGVRFDETELIEVPPDGVVLIAYSRGRGRLSGIETEALGASVWRISAGRITSLKVFQTREAALAAAGVAAQ